MTIFFKTNSAPGFAMARKTGSGTGCHLGKFIFPLIDKTLVS